MENSTLIEDYALLGDLQTAALVSREGSIDWCCFPRFDSAACFAALLGTPDHGRWLLRPDCEVLETTRRYIPDTLVLETVHRTKEGSVKVVDFMPPRGKAPDIVRIVEGLDGKVPMQSELIIRFDYGCIVPWVRRVDHSRVAIGGPDAIALRTPAEIHGEEMTTVSVFDIEPGDRVPFVMTWFPSHQPLPDPVDAEEALDDTLDYWLEWAQGCMYRDDYHEEVRHSLRILKAMTHRQTGGIVAAPTTSLPEHIGGVRNWDYRYCWLRDATLTIVAMLGAGYLSEAESWRDWLIRAVAGNPNDIQIMYGLSGERRLDEWEANWLPGYENSVPVRIGNHASNQLQLDVYGELLEAAYMTRARGIPGSDHSWSVITHLMEWLETNWRQKDAGIWEVRGPYRHFTHSKVMAWVAFDRAIRMCEEFDREGPVDKWKSIREEIHAEVLREGWCENKQAFAQYYGGDALDASILLMPIMGFLPADDPRMISTVEAIRDELSVDGFLFRYREHEGDVDGLPAGEGVFLPCSFWLVEVLALQERMDEARSLFHRLLDLRNDLGLIAEEYDPVTKRQLGNFPQAFTHLALIEAALTLSGGPQMHSPRSLLESQELPGTRSHSVE